MPKPEETDGPCEFCVRGQDDIDPQCDVCQKCEAELHCMIMADDRDVRLFKR